MAQRKRLSVMVSSAVYGNEQLLKRISATLSPNYDVWMSHEGTVYVNSQLGNFKNCLVAVEQCDVLLGVITGYYGSGQEAKGQPSITHLEMRRALELDKPHYCMAHAHVTLARQLLGPYRMAPAKGPFRQLDNGSYQLIEWPRHNRIISDLQVLDLYDEMTRANVPDLGARTGNWVHTYDSDEAALKYIDAQFGNVKRMRKMVAGTLPSGT